MSNAPLSLGFGTSFESLYARQGLVELDTVFRKELASADAVLAASYEKAREAPGTLDAKAEASLLMAIAPHLESFLVRLFAIEDEIADLHARQASLEALFEVKRLFVQRRALKSVKPDEAQTLDGPGLAARLTVLGSDPGDELHFASAVKERLQDETTHADFLDLAARYAAWAVLTQEGKRHHRKGRLFRAPEKHNPLHLVDVERIEAHGIPMLQGPRANQRHREGFALTDPGADLLEALDETHYCIFCHHQGRDSCSKGSKDKSGAFQKNALGSTLTGCPLEERISEMQEAKTQGHALSALAFACIENPMVAGTGHRICNDCMASCIYGNQNRTPVNVPEAETRILKDVLELPWGFEIYSLLTRWNPLNLRRPVPKPATGYKVLVVGMGPAGYTLSYHLMNEGHAVVGIDGLKIEPLEPELSGVTLEGKRVPFRPIRDVKELREPLEQRLLAGFGGVAEYGITVRWDKNFLKLLRLLLERRSSFALYGGVRLGGQMTPDDAFALGFDHVAYCMGAGKPTVIAMENGLARGVRQASDFLMALQLTGAARSDTLANLKIRLPVAVIGGGLTAIDTCTEALAYYPVQVEKFRARWEILAAEKGEEALTASFTPGELEQAKEFLAHARAIAQERLAAERENRPPHISDLLWQWGGATLVYRRRMVDSPAYRNHEEIAKAFEEGIRFAEEVTPLGVETDQAGWANALRVKTAQGEERSLPARTILVAAGTVPNTIIARETGSPDLDGKYFQALDEAGKKAKPDPLPKPAAAHVLTGSKTSFFGDLHPSFAGNVVSAMASAAKGYPVISRALATSPPSSTSFADLKAKLDHGLLAHVVAVTQLAPSIIEVTVKAPFAAMSFKPGQFYRLQNYEALAPLAEGTRLAMEGMALTGAWVDAEKGLVSVIVLEMGGSSDLCRLLKPGEPVVLMGPTGAPTETPAGESVLLAGGGLGNAVLFSIGQALRKARSKVLYFAGYRRAADLFKQDEIEAAADCVVWCVDAGDRIPPRRPQDKSFIGNIVNAMRAYAEGGLGETGIPLAADRLIAIGSDRMMAAVHAARHGVLAPHMKPGHAAIASINSPMQCMMKEICGQCLQRHVDTKTGQEFTVFTCSNQDQDMDAVDFANLASRLRQNGTQEKLTRFWIDRSLRRLGLRS
jgi:NADPH-dependent glutamate synthase beta subunit-like oxidoreductase/NAD(P)H-flavin reductase